MSEDIKVVHETDNYRLIVNNERYQVINTEYNVLEMETPVLPEAWNFMEKAQQFYRVNIKPTGTVIHRGD